MSALDQLVTAKLAKAEEFLEVAKLVVDSAHDAATSLAVSAAINASDVILIRATGTAPTGAGAHAEAVKSLSRAGFPTAAKQLSRQLHYKNPAQYLARRLMRSEADQAITRAERLIEQARKA